MFHMKHLRFSTCVANHSKTVLFHVKHEHLFFLLLCAILFTSKPYTLPKTVTTPTKQHSQPVKRKRTKVAKSQYLFTVHATICFLKIPCEFYFKVRVKR